MMRGFPIQLVLDEESSIWCSHLIIRVWSLKFEERAEEQERALEKRAAMMTLVPANGQVGSSTSDPTYMPDDRVTLSRFLLFVLLSSVSRVFEMSEGVF
jgi:hypothetical protein